MVCQKNWKESQQLQKALNKFEAVPEENSKWLVQKNTFVYNIFFNFSSTM